MKLYRKYQLFRVWIKDEKDKKIVPTVFSAGKLFFLEEGKKYTSEIHEDMHIYQSYSFDEPAPYSGVCVVMDEKYDVEPIWANVKLVPENYICGVKMILGEKKLIALKDAKAISILEFKDDNLISFKRVENE